MNSPIKKLRFDPLAKHLEMGKKDNVDLESNTSQNDVDKLAEEVVEEVVEEEEDPYDLTLEDIYDTVDESAFNPIIQNRPPAPLPRPQPGSERETPMIFRGCARSSFPTSILLNVARFLKLLHKTLIQPIFFPNSVFR